MTDTARILIVDDELFFRTAISDVLGGEGFQTVAAETGEDALEQITDPSLGVVVLDIRLPDIDGIQVLARIRELRPSLRVIMLSASTDQDLVLEALRLGACDYLAKPLHEEELVLSVRRAVESYAVEHDWTVLRGRLEKLAAAMQGLAQETARLAGPPRLEAVYEGAVRIVEQVLEAGRSSLMVYTENGDELEVVAARGHRVPLQELERVAPGEGVAGVVVQRGEALVVRDVTSDPLFAGQTMDERYASRSFAVAPLLERDEPIGVVCATDRTDGAVFSDDDLALLRILAMQLNELVMSRPPGDDTLTVGGGVFVAEELADGVDSALELGDAPPKHDDDLEGLDRDAELARLICQAVIDEIEPSRVVRAALAPIVGLLPAAPVALYLLDSETGRLRQEGECDGSVGSDRVELDAEKGLTGMVVRTGHMIATPEPELDSRFDAANDTPESGEPRPMMCLPISFRGKVVGVFRAFLPAGDSPSVRTGEVLSAALSATVRNVLLYRSLVESIEEVAAARREARR
jgi:CheY-like chemotaxis protein/GAF domain-containing protein